MRLHPLLLGALILGVAAPVAAQPRPYRGAHPIDLDGNWHFEEDVHVHDTLPAGLGGFGEFEGVLVFLGDPTAFGWTGSLYAYDGAHPVAGVAGYCGMTGVHEHVFPPEGSFRQNDAGVYTYTGAMRGGVSVVRPSRPVPPHPVTVVGTAQRFAYWGGSPFMFNGCMHQVVLGPGGSFTRVPLAGCTPQRFGFGGRRGPAPRPMTPVQTPRFEGPAFQTVPGRVASPRGDRRPQR